MSTSNASLLNVEFSYPPTNLISCSDNGITLYSIEGNKFEKKTKILFSGGIGNVSMTANSNIIYLVGGGETPMKSPDTFSIYDAKTTQIISATTDEDKILNIKNCGNLIVIVALKRIHVFKINQNGQPIKFLTKLTYSNPHGLCVINNNLNLTDKTKEILISTPGSSIGTASVWNPNTESYLPFNAHDGELECIAINNEGTFIATASEKGTLIRIFKVDMGKKEYEFRRGTSSATIYNMCFNKDSTILACCSSHGTVHLFSLSEKIKNKRSVFSGLKYVSGYFDSKWCFRVLDISTKKSTCTFDNDDVLHIACVDGKYYRIEGPEYNEVKEFLFDIL